LGARNSYYSLPGVTLATKSKVVCPIRVSPMCYFRIPTRESFFRRFGADQCASSEGFLVTFTPGSRSRSRKNLFLNLEDSLGDSLGGVHFSRTPKYLCALLRTLERRPPSNPGRRQCRKSSYFFFHVEPERLREGSHRSAERRGSVRKYPECDTTEELPGGLRFRDLMIPDSKTLSLGILVTLKPTDEGRIGNGRNTQERKTQERNWRATGNA